MIFSTVNPELILNEISLLQYVKPLRHSPKLVDCYIVDYKHFLVFEYCRYAPFINLINDLSTSEIKDYMRELLSAVCELHSLGIMHRDIKPSNFLYDKVTKQGFLIDYGLSEIVKFDS
jgi:cell division control protein 7